MKRTIGDRMFRLSEIFNIPSADPRSPNVSSFCFHLSAFCPGFVACSSSIKYSMACSFESPHMANVGRRLEHTAGRSGLFHNKHRLSLLS